MTILFVTDKYFPKPFANAICAQEMIDCFLEIGYEVHVLAFEDAYTKQISNWNGAYVHVIKPDCRLQLYYYADNFPTQRSSKIARKVASFLSKSKGLALMPIQPFYSIAFPLRICSKIEKLHERYQFDGIVSIYNPFDGALGATIFKKKHPEVPLVIYNVDTMVKAALKKYFNGIFADFFRWEKLFLKYCDGYFFMESRKDRYQQTRFLEWKDKLIGVDLPRFSVKKFNRVCEVEDPYVRPAEHWVYAGSLNAKDYPVADLIDFFLGLPQDKKRFLHFFGRGNQLEKIRQWEKTSNGKVIAHGYTEFEQLKANLFYADVLVSIKYSNQISAKIFEYLSYGKTIIHFSGNIEDPDVQYLNKYPKAYIVKTYLADEKKSFAQFLSWYQQQNDINCDDKLLNELYQKSTPEYSVDKIIKQLKI